MVHIIPTTSYVQRRAQSSRQPPPDVATIARRITMDEEAALRAWKLLDTPQTVKSLSRSLHLKSSSDKAEENIAAYMRELLQEDLIEVSPDT
jgi:hypothetical protein